MTNDMAIIPLSGIAGLVMAETVTPDVIGLVEKLGITGAFALVLWWLLNRLSRQLQENTDAIKELAKAIMEKK